MNAHARRRGNAVLRVLLPPECREMIRRGALVSISTSGGKDSQAMTILLARIVPRDQLVAVHAPLGKIEWPGTIDHILATLPEGVPLILAPVSSGKTLLDRVEDPLGTVQDIVGGTGGQLAAALAVGAALVGSVLRFNAMQLMGAVGVGIAAGAGTGIVTGLVGTAIV